MTQPTAIADLELSLRQQGERYVADLRFVPAGQAVTVELLTGGWVDLQPERLLPLLLDPDAYGAQLSATLFADQALRSGWDQACALAAGAGANLRLRLRLDGKSDLLHSLRWELLRDPRTGRPIALSEQIRFSRYLDSSSLTPVTIPASPALGALVVVANPTDLARFQLDPIDVASELQCARAALGDIPTAVLARASTGSPVTLSGIAAALRAGPQIVYLVAHGSQVEGEAYLWLENEAGASAHVSASRVEQMLASLMVRPLLVCLVSCRSAGHAHQPGALAALGPRLAQVGVAAVLAMQGDVSDQAVERLMPAFFSELRRDGAVDRALAAARLLLQDDLEWWSPVLFLRVRDGRLWTKPEPSEPGTRPPDPAPGFHQELRRVLASCDEFDSNNSLRAVFTRPELQPWYGGLREADNLNARVSLTIAYLAPKRHVSGASALALFLRALAEAYDPEDARHGELRALAERAAQA